MFLIPSWTVCKWKSVIYQDTSCRCGQKCLCTPCSASPGSTQDLPGHLHCSLQFCRDFQVTLVAQRDTGSTLHGVEFAACLVWFTDPDHQLCTQENWGMQTWRMRPGVRGLHLRTGQRTTRGFPSFQPLTLPTAELHSQPLRPST